MLMNRSFRRVLVAVVSGAVVASLAMAASPPSSQAQTAAALSIVITPEVPSGASLSTLPTGTGQRVFIQVTNPTGAAALTNQQFVVRFAAKPDVISSVNDGVGSIGLIEPVTGAWYHTIAQLPPGATVTYSVSAFKFCPGRWPIAARVGDKLSVVLASWVGQPDARCGADEVLSPAPASFYTLAWPSSTGGLPIVPPANSTTTTTLAPVGVSTTTVPGAVVPTTTVPGAPRPSLINLTLTASTTTTTTTTTSTTIRPRAGAGPTTTVLFCKTVGGKSYCAPKFSVYKPGQKKIVEIKKKTTKRTTKRR